MMNTTFFEEETMTRQEVYEDLLLRRDQLERKAIDYQIEYTQEFGEQICANFEIKLECIKKKKAISYCRRRQNRGLAVDTEKMEAEIEKEMKLYYVELKDMLKSYHSAQDTKTVGHYEASRVKKIYRRLAKLLHPDINKKTAESRELSDLWNRVVEAYDALDVNKLEDLEVLIKRTLEELGDEGFELQVDNIEERIERLERQINEIMTTEPYTYRELLEDEERKKTRHDELNSEHEDYEQYLETLTRALEDMLREGGSKVVWLMN
ncbi:MAG: hypothetical protein J6T47_10255 [Lachnospiraceae bacterium]|nr:hypothetical protein [Lachnospiraceae bacterium]